MRTVLTLSAMTLLLFSCKNKPSGNMQQAKPYPVVEVVQKNITGYQEFPTQIQGVNNNAVRAKIQGYITKVLVDEGQQVSKGQVLFRLETNTLNQSASAAQAGMKASKANIEAAKASVNAAKVEVNRLKPLVERNIISSVQLETANANLKSAQSQLAQAQAGYSRSSASYQEVQANIGYSVIRAPISGTVGKINQREGSLVGPNSQMPFTTVSQTNQVYAYFAMNERQYLDFLYQTEGKTTEDKLKNTPEVTLVLANGQTYEETGRIEAVTGQIDPNSGTVQFRASFKNENKILSNGNSGTIKIPQEHKNVMVVPEQATYEQQGYVYVFKVVQDTVRSTRIEVSARINNLALVANGLKTGDQVVAQGVGILRDGAAIKPQPVRLDSIVLKR